MKYFTNSLVLTKRNGARVKARVELKIDVDELFHVLGQQALRNKSRQTKFLHGLVTATLYNEEELS